MKTIQLDDRTIHIVKTPEEAEKLKRSNSDLGFDWHFHGSPEHIEALKRAHELHTSQDLALKEKHPDVYAEMIRIRQQMDALSHELDKLTASPVELQANFDKFGYSAHIKTHDAEDEEKGGMDEEMVDGALATGMHLRKEDHPRGQKSTTIPIYKRPVLRQYFHNGVLYRARAAEEVASCELFVDLLYVGIIAFHGDKATEMPTGLGFLHFAVTFIPSWKIWTDIGMLVSQFDTDDLTQRTLVLFVLACLLGFTINIVAAFDTTWSQLIVFYVAARVCSVLFHVWMSFALPHVRNIMRWNTIIGLISVGLWIGAIYVPFNQKEGIIWVAIFWDLTGHLIGVFCIRGTKYISMRLHKKMLQIFEYYPAMNIEHKTERMGAFVSLVFGYSVVALLYQNQATFGMNAFWGKAILGLIQAYAFNMMYFDVDGSYHHIHAIRRHSLTASIWTTAHLPFIMGFTLAGAALSRLVVAHDCANADPETLTETYQERSEGELLDGWRWFYCAGLAVSFICMALISASHIHSPLPTQRIRKKYRLTFRVVIAIIWLCLPVATSLNSLELIGTTTAMTVLALGIDIYGMSCSQESFFCSDTCKYDCKKLGSTSDVNSLASSEKERQLYHYFCRSGA